MNKRIYLKQQFFDSLIALSTAEGINASGKEEIYGCIFGRDSAITILKILHALNSQSFSESNSSTLYTICKNALLRLCTLQGKKSNIESGEEPGKFIHEYRKEKFEHLLTLEKPWYVYPDGILRNYDSLDATPLALIAIYKYWEQTHDAEFLLAVLPFVEKGLNWIISYGDKDKDYLVEYILAPERKYGGLKVQSWTDSHESLLSKDMQMPKYPIAPVEVQGYVWLALRLWADFYESTNNLGHTKKFAQKLLKRAMKIKKIFNESFIIEDSNYYFAAQALDGCKNKIVTITGNPLLLLWATYKSNSSPKECILDGKYVESFVSRGFLDDLFDPEAGIRTMSTTSPTFNPGTSSYHNGSFWPKLNGMIHEGLLNWNFTEKADALKEASLKPLEYFNGPIELYIKTASGTFEEWVNDTTGQRSCRKQAWSAAVGLDLLSY